jgi:Ca2+-binding RTX toxin-like protein
MKPLIDALESRRLLSVGTITVSNGGTGTTGTLLLGGDATAARTEILAGGSLHPLPVHATSTGTLQVHTGAGKDVVAIERKGGTIWVHLKVASFDNTVMNVGVPAKTVKRINVGTDGGADRITLDASITLRATLTGGGGNDTITGGAGQETISGGAGDDVVDSGPVVLSNATRAYILTGKPGPGTNFATDGPSDVLLGGSGDDTIIGGSVLDRVSGGDGHDTLRTAATAGGYVVGVEVLQNKSGTGVPELLIIN